MTRVHSAYLQLAAVIVMLIHFYGGQAGPVTLQLLRDRRATWEMTGAMFVEAGVLIAAHWAGVVSGSTVVAWQHALMVPVMIAVMLFRLDLYTGRADDAAEAS